MGKVTAIDGMSRKISTYRNLFVSVCLSVIRFVKEKCGPINAAVIRKYC